MNTADVKTVKMFGPSISDPTRMVNRDVPACDEQAYKAAGYKRGSVPEPEPVAEPEPPQVELVERLVESVQEKPAKSRKAQRSRINAVEKY